MNRPSALAIAAVALTVAASPSSCSSPDEASDPEPNGAASGGQTSMGGAVAGGGTDVNAGAPAHGGDNASGGAQDAPDCIEVHDACSEDSGRGLDPWLVLLEASSLDAGARLVATAGVAVLAQYGDDSWHVVATLEGLFNDIDPQTVYSWDFPDAQLLPMDVAATRGSAEILALACDADATRCRLFRGHIDDVLSGPNPAVLEEWPNSVLPAEVEPRGLVYDSLYYRPCVFGNALVCLEAQWETVIPIEPGLELVDVLFTQPSVAVAADGRWWRGVPTPWTEQTPVQGELRGAALLQDRIALVGKEGLWFPEDSGVQQCVLPEHVVGVLNWDMLESDGTLLSYVAVEGAGPGWCETDRVELLGDVIDITNAPCASSENYRVLTAARLVGRNSCTMID